MTYNASDYTWHAGFFTLDQMREALASQSKDRLNVPVSIYRRGSAWCSECGHDFDLGSIYKIGRLYLCEPCWRGIVIIYGECFSNEITLHRAIYAAQE